MRIFSLIFLFVYSLHAGFYIEKISEKPRIFVIPDFLSTEECDYIIAASRPHLRRSTVTDDQKVHAGVVDPRRTSQGMFFPANSTDPVLRRLDQRIADLTGLPVENGEPIQVLSYQVEGEYQPHYDYFSPNTVGGVSQLKRGGQRIATVIMYLNTPEAGGETIFPKVKISVSPKKGTALLFYSCTPWGSVDPLTLHGGAPVKVGEKWIATKWLHEREFH